MSTGIPTPQKCVYLLSFDIYNCDIPSSFSAASSPPLGQTQTSHRRVHAYKFRDFHRWAPQMRTCLQDFKISTDERHRWVLSCKTSRFPQMSATDKCALTRFLRKLVGQWLSRFLRNKCTLAVHSILLRILYESIIRIFSLRNHHIYVMAIIAKPLISGTLHTITI